MTSEAHIGTAPGRLDMLGGVADYSGSLVLETPIQGTTHVSLSKLSEPVLRFASDQSAGTFEISLDLLKTCYPLSGASRRDWLDGHSVPAYVRYVLGCLLLLVEDRSVVVEDGLSFRISSTVPISMGVSSSAALEVASMRALAQCFGVDFTGTELARLAQRVENEIVGAPCGLMDQLTSAHGIPGTVLPILCRPDILHDPVPLPDGITAVGWSSGIAHDVSGSPYATARCATFMGFEIFKQQTGGQWIYPSEVPVSLFDSERRRMPETILGRDFLDRYGLVEDPLSNVQPEAIYPVRDALTFPIEEHARANRVVKLLKDAERDESALIEIGEAMYASHQGYSRIGLGHPSTDAMVARIQERGSGNGFHGARVSGGGCGGTVVVLIHQDALPVLQRLCDTETAQGQLIPSAS